MTAAALAGELGLPLFSIQLDALITKFLGETAAKLRLIFDSIRETRAVYLFDEFDALGAERGAKNEVGEIRRVLNSFLQFMEQDESDSLIIAATNHPKLLDRALLRRFDALVRYALPSHEEAERVLRDRLALLDTSEVAWQSVIPSTDGLSHAELSRAAQQAAKHAILEYRASVLTGELVGALEDRRSAHGG
jgi:SpoVK/Ycf46/Vps4 family AAA+-type ATPase